MTDQPNPVGLKKEISGHPTDHSRKALGRRVRRAYSGDFQAWVGRAQDAKLSDLSGEALALLYIMLGEKAWRE